MANYNDFHPNKSNINDFNAGIADTNIHTPGYSYQYNALAPENGMQHGYSLSLACQSGTDTLHAIGNVTAIILQFVLDLFPPETFATALPSTKLASRQLRHTPKQIRTQPYPMCIVNPRVSLSGLDGRFTAGSFATSLWSTTSNRFQNRSEMEKLFFDSRKGIEWRGKINRVVMMFDFVLSFKSIGEQIRWASYLINKIPTDGGFFDIDTALELAIPDGFLEETSRYAGIPVKTETGSVARFTDYLNMNSVYPISYRFSSGKHKDAFYAHYMTSLLCNIGDLNYSNVGRVDHVEADCPITFTIRCEFNTIGMFDLSVPNPGPFVIRDPKPSGIIIPIFSDNFNEKDFPLAYGWKLLAKPIVHLDWDEREIDIRSIFSDTINMIIDYHLEHGMNPELFLSVKLRENQYLIEDGYYVDWKQRKLIFTTVNYTHTYRLLIAMDHLYVQNLLMELYGKTSNSI
jgi:hypothetical protein